MRLPYDPATGALVPEVWERWLAWDPVRMAPRYATALRGVKAIYVAAGTRDEAYLDLGAEAFRQALAALERLRSLAADIGASHGTVRFIGCDGVRDRG